MYINSNERKVELSSWLKLNQPSEFSDNLKLQKFLFFYEVLSKIENEEADFSYLRAYPNGPVFSNVYGDYVYQSLAFITRLDEFVDKPINEVNEERAKFAGFLVKILNEKELSDLTHELDAWKIHEPQIENGERNIDIHESDFTEDDFNLLQTLKEMYPIELIDNSVVISIMDKNFVLPTEDFYALTDEQRKVFLTLVDEDLNNPIYVNLTEEGVLLID